MEDFGQEIKLGEIGNLFSESLDLAIDSFEDGEILKKVLEKYPDFVPTNTEKELRRLFLEILVDRKLVKYILKYYSLSLPDFITIVYHNYPLLFGSSLFIRKLQETIKKHRFLKCAKN